MIRPRQYQVESVSAIFRYFQAKPTGSPIVAMPGGTGKSVCIAMFICSLFNVAPGSRVVMLTHVKKLIEQNHAKLKELWPAAPTNIFSAGLNQKDVGAPILFAGIQSVAKIADQLGHVDALLIDEAHLVGDADNAQYLKVIEALRAVNPWLRIIGWSASPYRMGMGPLTNGGIFTDICFDITRREDFTRLIADGYLAPLVARETSLELDVTGVTTSSTGDYNNRELNDAVDTDELNRRACAEIVQTAYAENRTRWLIFTAGVAHAEHIASILRTEHGISCVTMHSKLGQKVCDENEHAFIAGKVTACVTNNMFTTGVDCPEIDVIAFLRPTKSTALWVQMLSRGTRPAVWAAKVNCRVLDFARNSMRLGPINDPRIPRGRRAKGMAEESQGAPVRLCPHCKAYSHARAVACEECGADFPTVIKLDAQASTAPVMDLELPKVERFPVSFVQYFRHKKKDKPDSLRATYVCGILPFSDYICFEHGKDLHARASRWWRERCATGPIPDTITEALEMQKALRQPKAILVWTNKQRPEITGYEF